MKTHPHVLDALRAGLAAHADCTYRLDQASHTAYFACEVTVDYAGADSLADIKREHLARALAANDNSVFPSWARALERHDDGRVCLLNAVSDAWYVDAEADGTRPRVRPVCDRAHLTDLAGLDDDDDRVTGAAAAIYNGGEPEEWLSTVDGSPNAASYHYARVALGSLNPTREPETGTETGTGDWTATLVHGNDAVATGSFATVDAALGWARAEERKRHPHSGGVFDDSFKVEREDFVQHGTGYHWLTVERTEAGPAQEA